MNNIKLHQALDARIILSGPAIVTIKALGRGLLVGMYENDGGDWAVIINTDQLRVFYICDDEATAQTLYDGIMKRGATIEKYEAQDGDN